MSELTSKLQLQVPPSDSRDGLNSGDTPPVYADANGMEPRLHFLGRVRLAKFETDQTDLQRRIHSIRNRECILKGRFKDIELDTLTDEGYFSKRTSPNSQEDTLTDEGYVSKRPSLNSQKGTFELDKKAAVDLAIQSATAELYTGLRAKARLGLKETTYPQSLGIEAAMSSVAIRTPDDTTIDHIPFKPFKVLPAGRGTTRDTTEPPSTEDPFTEFQYSSRGELLMGDQPIRPTTRPGKTDNLLRHASTVQSESSLIQSDEDPLTNVEEEEDRLHRLPKIIPEQGVTYRVITCNSGPGEGYTSNGTSTSENQQSAPSQSLSGNNRRDRGKKKRDEDNNADKPHKKPYPEGVRDGNGRLRVLACPFYRWDPIKYRLCRGYHLPCMTQVKEHIRRHYCLPNYCGFCLGEFETKATLGEHTANRNCTEHLGLKFKEGYDKEETKHEELLGLGRRVDQRKTPCEQWYEIFDALFLPHKPRPLSPYADEGHYDTVEHLRKFKQQPEWQNTSDAFHRDLVPEGLRSQTTRECNDQYLETFLRSFERFCILVDRPPINSDSGYLSQTSHSMTNTADRSPLEQVQGSYSRRQTSSRFITNNSLAIAEPLATFSSYPLGVFNNTGFSYDNDISWPQETYPDTIQPNMLQRAFNPEMDIDVSHQDNLASAATNGDHLADEMEQPE